MVEQNILAALRIGNNYIECLEGPICNITTRAQQLSRFWSLSERELGRKDSEAQLSSGTINNICLSESAMYRVATNLKPYVLPSDIKSKKHLGICDLLPILFTEKLHSSGEEEIKLDLNDVPVFLMKGWNAAATMESCFPDFFAPLPSPPPKFELNWEEIYGKRGISIDSLVAQDLVLEDDTCMLPAVVIREGLDDATARSCSIGCHVQLLKDECDISPVSSSHAALFLDWSLTSKNAALQPQELVFAAKQLKNQISPRLVNLCSKNENSKTESTVLSFLLSGYYCRQSFSDRPCAVQRDLRKLTIHQNKDPVAIDKQCKISAPEGATSKHEHQEDRGRRLKIRCSIACSEISGYSEGSFTDGTNMAASGVLPGNLPDECFPGISAASASPDEVQLPSMEEELHYFLRLHKAPGLHEMYVAHQESSDSAVDNIQDFLSSSARSITQVQLSDSHLQVIRQLQEDENGILMTTSGIDAAIATSDIFSLDILYQELQNLQGMAMLKFDGIFAATWVV